MSNVFLGQIMMFGGNFAPRGFAFCNGDTLSISQNSALFSLLGTNYGGNGQTTFQLPNLQSQVPIHQGTGLGLSNYDIGQTGGSANVTLTTNEMASHSHTLNATATNATVSAIGNTTLPGQPTVGNPPHFYASQGQPPLNVYTFNPAACGNAGGSTPHPNLMPTLCITFCIALQGMFPARN
ncbi:MAG TPA: tail fiber protein [Stellaceae bacterium]|jgi:microcystin-dependent protein